MGQVWGISEDVFLGRLSFVVFDGSISIVDAFPVDRNLELELRAPKPGNKYD